MALKEEVVTSEPNLSVPDKIADAFSALKAAGIWPKKEAIRKPADNDDNANLFLRIVPNESHKRFKLFESFKTLKVRHPLSLRLNRSVCFVFDSNDEIDKSNIEQAWIDLGVVGEFTIAEIQDVETEVLQRSDVVLVGSQTHFFKGAKAKEAHLRSQIEKKAGRAVRIQHWRAVGGCIDFKQKISLLLRTTSITHDSLDRSLLAKVGRTNMTEGQIKDNIIMALSSVAFFDHFWESIKEVGLKTGSSKTVAVYDLTESPVDATVGVSESRAWRAKIAKEVKKPRVYAECTCCEYLLTSNAKEKFKTAKEEARKKRLASETPKQKTRRLAAEAKRAKKIEKWETMSLNERAVKMAAVDKRMTETQAERAKRIEEDINARRTKREAAKAVRRAIFEAKMAADALNTAANESNVPNGNDDGPPMRKKSKQTESGDGAQAAPFKDMMAELIEIAKKSYYLSLQTNNNAGPGPSQVSVNDSAPTGIDDGSPMPKKLNKRKRKRKGSAQTLSNNDVDVTPTLVNESAPTGLGIGSPKPKKLNKRKRKGGAQTPSNNNVDVTPTLVNESSPTGLGIGSPMPKKLNKRKRKRKGGAQAPSNNDVDVTPTLVNESAPTGLGIGSPMPKKLNPRKRKGIELSPSNNDVDVTPTLVNDSAPTGLDVGSPKPRNLNLRKSKGRVESASSNGFNPKPALAIGSLPKGLEVSSPKPRNLNLQKSKGSAQAASSNVMVTEVINSAKKSVFSPKKVSNIIALKSPATNQKNKGKSKSPKTVKVAAL